MSEAFGHRGEVNLVEVEEDGDTGIGLNDIDEPGIAGPANRSGELQGGAFVGQVSKSGLITQRQELIYHNEPQRHREHRAKTTQRRG